MARNQSSEFRRSHEKTRILVKDYSKDFYLDLHHRLFLSRLGIVKACFHSTLAAPKIRACKAIHYKILPKSEVFERIFSSIFVKDCILVACRQDVLE